MRFLLQRQYEVGTEVTQRTHGVRVIQSDELKIGRGTNVDLHFDDVSVDLWHATLLYQDGKYYVEDRSSLTGTYLNGTRTERAEVKAGDLVEIGDHRIQLGQGAPGHPLDVTLLPPAADPDARPKPEDAATAVHGLGEDAGPAPAKRGDSAPLGEADEKETAALPAVDEDAPAAASTAAPPTRVPQLRRASRRRFKEIHYVKAYGLKRPLVSKTSLSVLTAALVLASLAWVVRADRRDVFQPGTLSRAHQLLAGPDSCGACHTPWQGLSGARCMDCHPGPQHNPQQTRTPECMECHVEHRFLPRLAAVDNQVCVDCHAAGRRSDGSPGVFASSIRSFRHDHPDFSLTVSRDGGEERLALAEAVAQKADATVLDFNHARHLDPQRLQGEVLVCSDCHLQAPDARHMTQVNYDDHCRRCHQLGFDRNYPPAPHEDSELVYDHILATYAEAGGGPAPRSSDRRRLLIFQRGQQTLSVDEQVERRAFSAAERLFENQCDKCHELLEVEEFPPQIVPPRIPADWLPHGRFSHERHQMVECGTCHTKVAASRDTGDVLLPGIDTCRPCHGGPREDEERRGLAALLAAPTASATTECVSCHLYHARSKDGSWAKNAAKKDPEGGEP